jgi:hypothetical protein
VGIKKLRYDFKVASVHLFFLIHKMDCDLLCGLQSNLLNGDPKVFLNIRQVLGLVVPHAAALTVTAAMNYCRKL